jgi:hypothetical protein
LPPIAHEGPRPSPSNSVIREHGPRHGANLRYSPGMRNVLFGVALALAGVSGCNKSDEKAPAATAAEETFPTMTVDQVEAALAANQITAVDCNPEMTRKHMGVVPGAILVTDEAEYAPSELPADKTTKLLFYCSSPG